MRSVVIDPRKRRPFDKLAATADGKVSRQPFGAPLSSPDYSIYDRYIDPNGPADLVNLSAAPQLSNAAPLGFPSYRRDIALRK